MRGRRLWIGALGWLAVGLLGTAAIVVQAGAGHPSVPEVIAHIPPFELTDQDGQPFGTTQLRGRVWVAGFAFTSCTSVCPMLTAQMANLQRRLGGRAHLVTITVDPETDTPARLREFAVRHHADLATWTFLTGQREQVMTTLTRGFLLAIGDRHDTPDGYDILHTASLLLIDRELGLRGLYRTDADGLEALVRDATLLADRP